MPALVIGLGFGARGGLDYAAVSIVIKRLEHKAVAETKGRKRMEMIGTMWNVET